jgi:thiomorpholine-carboxylate dehydrogenase
VSLEQRVAATRRAACHRNEEVSPMLYVTDAQVREVLQWDDLIAAMEEALAALSCGRVVQPLRSWLTVEAEKFWGVMPAVGKDAMGIKLVSFYPQNAGAGLPTVLATVVLFDADTGEPLAVMDARTLTAMRTAAVSAAVTKRLSSPDSRVLALLGSGAQAQAHLQALRRVRKFEEIRVWSRTRAHAQRFAEQFGAVAMDAESAVRGADVVVAATSTQSAILEGAWLKHGAHVNSIGAPMPTWRELDDDAMANAVVVEQRDAALHESGDIILSHARIHAEIGELIAGTKTIDAAQTTIFKSVGVAIEDVAAARLVFDAVSRAAHDSGAV